MSTTSSHGWAHSQRGPPINGYYGKQLARISNEAGEVLMLPEGSEGSFQRMRNFVEMVCRRCRRMETKMNCTAARDVVQLALARSGLSHATSSRAMTSTSAARDDEQDDDDNDDDMDARLPHEMVLSDLVGAPTTMQPPQATPPCRKHRDHMDTSSVNIVEGIGGEHPASRFTPGIGLCRKRKWCNEWIYAYMNE